MKKLKDFTPEIQAKIPEYQKRVLESIYNGSKYHNFDLEKAKKAIKWNYEKCGYKMPVVLVAENPLEQQYLFNYLKLNKNYYEKILYVLQNDFIEVEINNTKCKISSYFILFFSFNNQLSSQLESQLDSQLHSQLHSQLCNQLHSQLHSQLESQLRNQLSSQLYNQLDDQLDSQLRNQLHSQLHSQLDSQLRNQLSSQLHSQLRSQLRNQLDSQLRNQLSSQLDSQLRNQLSSQLHSQLHSQLDSQFHSQLHSQLESQLRNQLSSQLHSQLDSQLRNQLESQLRNQLSSQLYNQLDDQLDSQLYNQLESTLRSQLSSQLRNQLESTLRNQLSSQLHSQLDSQLDNQLDNQLDSQLYNQLESQLRNQLSSQLRNQLESTLRNQLSSQLRSQLDNQLDNQLDSQLYNQLESQLRNQLSSQLRNQLESTLRNQLDNNKLKDISQYNTNYLFTLNIYSEVYYTWFEFIRKEFDLPLTINDDFQECFKLHSESGIYSAIFSEEVCVISKYPLDIHQEQSQFRLNNTEKSAVIWSNSFAPFDCYYINGLNISKDLFEKLSKKEVSFEDWSNESNEEIKSAILSFYQQKFGDEYLYQFLSKNLKEVDTYVDKKDKIYLEGTTNGMNIGVYTLFKGDINRTKIAYIRCYCPSTDRMFFLGVNPDNTNAKNAIASLYQIPVKLKDEIISIQRQGEVFSTNFTEKGLFLLKNMSKEDIQNMVSISGNEYFNLIKYEY